MKDALKDPMSNPIGTVATGAEDPRPSVAVEEHRDGLRVNLAYTDLRQWIEEAEKLGEVRVITGASWQEEIGMAAELALHSDAAPCLIFDEVPGCPQCGGRRFKRSSAAGART